MTTDRLRVVEFTGPEASAARDGFEVCRAVQEHDRPTDSPPSWRSFAARPQWPYPGSVERLFTVFDEQVPVAWFGVYLQVEDNLDVAQMEIEVHPDHRRRGIAREILARQFPTFRSGGRSRCLFEAPMEGPGGDFLRAAGARVVIADTQRRLDLALVDTARHDELMRDAASHASAYEVVEWVGATPADLRDDVAVLHARMSTDPPLDDLAWEPEDFDAEKVVARDRMMEAHGMRAYVAAARHRETGTVVAITTVVSYSDVPRFGDQWETIVLPEHRGHRLGMLLKVGNLRHARTHEPDLEVVDTWNADSNEAMLAVNVAMGFVPVREGGEWELGI